MYPQGVNSPPVENPWYNWKESKVGCVPVGLTRSPLLRMAYSIFVLVHSKVLFHILFRQIKGGQQFLLQLFVLSEVP